MPDKTVSDDDLIAAVKEHGSHRKAAAALGMNARNVDRRMKRLAHRGFAPEFGLHRPVPDGLLATTSTLYSNQRGEILQWVKTRPDHARIEQMLREAAQAMAEDIPRAARVPPPEVTAADLLNAYVVTDYHLGMLSWREETGADWDVRIAEDLLVRWFATAIAQSPPADVGVLAQLGDFLHWDGLDAVTPASKHLLDADTRFQKIVRAAIRVLRQVVGMLLAKHRHVVVLMAEGNHDPASSIWLRELFASHFEDNPRIEVVVSPDPYYCIEHGQTSLFFHHGHKRKPAQIDDVFVAKFREVFGRTRHSYAHMGHMHHVEVKETNLMIVEQHRTLAAPDAYATRGGWISGRDAKVITYSKRHGEVGRLTINSAMALDAAA